MTGVLNKRMIMMQCKNCGKNVDISLSSEVAKLRALYTTVREDRNDMLERTLLMRGEKNGMIQAMNLTIKKMLNLMTPEQRSEAMKEIRFLRGKK